MRLLRTIVITVAGGLVIAVLLFWVTMTHFVYIGLPIGHAGVEANIVWDNGGTDPWTGEFRPPSRSYTFVATGEQRSQAFWPAGSGDHRAIPVPVGFALGCLVTLGLIAVVRRSRKTPPDPAASARPAA